jgi:predicted DNA-binding protein
MAVQNRISVSFKDPEFQILERLSTHTQKTKAELIRMIVEEYLRDNPNRFSPRDVNGRETQEEYCSTGTTQIALTNNISVAA